MLVPFTMHHSPDSLDTTAVETKQAHRVFTKTAKKVTAESASALRQVFETYEEVRISPAVTSRATPDPKDDVTAMFQCALQRVTPLSNDLSVTNLILSCTGTPKKSHTYSLASLLGMSLTFYTKREKKERIQVTRLDCGGGRHVTYGTIENDSGVCRLYISHNIPGLKTPLMGALLTFEHVDDSLVLKVRMLPEHVVLTDGVMYWVSTQLPSDCSEPNASVFENLMYHPVVNLSVDGTTVMSGAIAATSNEHNTFGKSLIYHRQRYLLKSRVLRKTVATHIDARLRTPANMQMMDKTLAKFVFQHMEPIDNPSWSTRFHVRWGTRCCVTDEAAFMGTAQTPQPDLLRVSHIMDLLKSHIEHLPTGYMDALKSLDSSAGIKNAIQSIRTHSEGAARVEAFDVVQNMLRQSIRETMHIGYSQKVWFVCVHRDARVMSQIVPRGFELLVLRETSPDDFVYMQIEMDACPQLDETLLIVTQKLQGTNEKAKTTTYKGNHGKKGYDVMKARPQAMADLVAFLQLQGRTQFKLQAYEFIRSENASQEHHSVNMRSWSRLATWGNENMAKTIVTSFCILRGLHERRRKRRDGATDSSSESEEDVEGDPTPVADRDRRAHRPSTYRHNHVLQHSGRGG